MERERYADDIVVMGFQYAYDNENSYDSEINEQGTSGGIDRDGGSSSIEGPCCDFVTQFNESVGDLTYERESGGGVMNELQLATSSSHVNGGRSNPDERI